jgi:hypothetical protein
MVDTPQTSALLIWTDTARVPLVRAMLDRSPGLQTAAVGGLRSGELAELAQQVDAPIFDDLRRMIMDTPAGFLLICESESLSREDLGVALERGMDILTLEPPFASTQDMVSNDRNPSPSSGRLVHAPMLRLCPAWLAAAEPQQALQRIESVSVISLADASNTSLYARLYDAMDLLVHLLGMPDAVDASLGGPLTGPPDSLRGLTGHLAAHLRYVNGSSAVVQVSDRARAWHRSVNVIGREGQLLFDDLHYRLTVAGSEESETGPASEPTTCDALLARQWQWMSQHRVGPDPVDLRSTLACCQAALLSCRTGQAESTRMLLQMRP